MPSTPLALGGEEGVDLLLGGLGRVDVGDHLDDLRPAAGLGDRLLDRLDAELGVGVDQEAGEVGDVALAAHRLDQLLGAEIGRAADVGAEAEQGRGRVLEAAGERDRRARRSRPAPASSRWCRRRRRGRCQEGVEALADQALDQLVLRPKLPLRRHLVVGRGEPEVALGVLPPPAPRRRSRGAARPAPAPPWCRWPPRRRPPPRRSWPQKRALLRSVSSVRPPALFVCPGPGAPHLYRTGRVMQPRTTRLTAASGAGPPPGPRPGSRGTRARPGRRGSARPSRPGP